ncbi:MAG: hypothetical protein ACE5I1_03975, partial [bacterium]
MKRNAYYHFTCLTHFVLIATTQTIAQYSRNTTLVGRRAEGPSYAVAASGSLAYFDNGFYLEIV